MKKILTLTLVLLIALSSVAMASSNAHLVNTDPNSIAVATELVELDLLLRGNPAHFAEYGDQKWFFQFCEKELNIKLNWEAVETASFWEKINILMGTDSMPDLVMASETITAADALKWGSQDGLLLAIDEYREYCPNYWAEMEKNQTFINVTTMLDGHTYGFCNIEVPLPQEASGIRLTINKKWLDNLGMEKPQTLDEFYNMLVAFRDNDANGNGNPDDEIPWHGVWQYRAGYPERLILYWAYGYTYGYGPDPAGVMKADTQEGFYAPCVPEYKEIIGFFKKCWDEGLLQDTMFSGTFEQNKALGQTQTDTSYYGFTIDCYPSELSANPDVMMHWEASQPFVANEGDTPVTWGRVTLNQYTWTISASTEYPEVAVKFCDFWYDPYWAICYWWGPEYGTEYDYNGTGWVFDRETNTTTWPGAEGYTDGDYRGNLNSMADWPFGMMDGTAKRYVWPETIEMYGKDWDAYNAQWIPSYNENTKPYEVINYCDYLVYTAEETEFFETRTPIWNYLSAQEAMFITGERDWSEFEMYQAELEEMGAGKLNDFLNYKLDEYFGRESDIEKNSWL